MPAMNERRLLDIGGAILCIGVVLAVYDILAYGKAPGWLTIIWMVMLLAAIVVITLATRRL